MALEFIERQPFIFQPRNETQDCKNPDTPCNLIADDDDVFVQFINEPCGSPLLCDSDFSGSGGDLIENGDFFTSAAGWTLGATWAYNAGGWVDVVGAGSTSLSQTIAATVNAGNCYTVFFRVLNYVSGSVSPSLGNTLGTSVNADGVYYQVITAGAANERLDFIPTAGAELSITDVQLFDMGFCWCPDNGNVFHSDPTVNSSMCHIPGAETILTQVGVTPPIANGNLYKVTMTITGRSAGSVHVIVGASAVSIDFIGNGSFTDYVLADGDDNFQIVFSSDFDGCTTDVDVYEMTTDFDLGVANIDETAVQELSGFAQYIDNRIVWAFNTSDFSFSYGCYRLVALDTCNASVNYSNCFNWQATHQGTQQVIAIDRASTDPTLRYSFGFLWFGVFFYLTQRVSLNFRKSKYNTKSISDRFSTGKHFKSYAEQSKAWELLMEFMSEDQHDAMAIMVQCKSWSIDGTEYFTQDEEYDPEWDDKGYDTAADVKLNVNRLQDVIFADNCNR